MKARSVIVTLLVVASIQLVDAQTARMRLLRIIRAAVEIVSNVHPISSISLSSGFYVDQLWTISTGGTGDPDGTIVSGTLDWGDGTTVPITGAPAATYEHTYTVVEDYAITLTVVDNDGAQASDVLNVTVRAVPPPGSGNRNDYFEFWSNPVNAPEIYRSWAMRSQQEVEDFTQNAMGLPTQWGYKWPSAMSSECQFNVCDDEYPLAPNGARLRMVPKGWRRDRASYPNGAFLYPEHAQHGATGNEGCANPCRLKFIAGASVAAGWDSVTYVYDFFWSEEYFTNRGAISGWKNFFISDAASAEGVNSFDSHYVEHNMTIGQVNPALGEVNAPKFQSADGPGASEGVQDNEPYTPTGLGALAFGNCKVHHSKWTRVFYDIKLDRMGSEFTDWIALTGFTPVTPRNMFSVYYMDEDRGLQRCLHRVPFRYEDGKTAISNFTIRFDQSNNILNQEEKQVIDLDTMEAGDTFTLTVPVFTNTRLGYTSVEETTGPISFSADMRVAINDELEALDGIDQVIVSKSGSSQDYTIRFIGSPSGMVNIPQMTITPTDAGGSLTFSPVITTTQQGNTNTYLGQGGIFYVYVSNVMLFKDLAFNESHPILEQPVP